MFKNFIKNPASKILTLTLLFVAVVLSMLFFWDLISSALDTVYASVPTMAFKDIRFYVITAVLLVILIAFYFQLNPKQILKLKSNFINNPVFWVVVTLLSLLALSALSSLLWALANGSEDTAIAVVDTLKRIPTDMNFYAIAIALVGLWISWRFHLHDKLGKKLTWGFRITARQGLCRNDWEVYLGFRERALALRTRSGLTLIGVFALLLGGIYLIMFILPQIKSSDLWLLRERNLTIFQERFGKKLQAMVEGRYWLKAYDWGSKRSESPLELIANIRTDDFKMFPGIGSSIGGTATNGKIFLARTNGMGLATVDGGNNWERRDLKLKNGEGFAGSVLSKNGQHGLLLGDEGTAFMTKNSGQNWKNANSLQITDWINLAVLSDDGKRALITDDESSVFFLQKNGDMWNKVNLKTQKLIQPEEEITFAVLSDNGTHGLIAGDKGSVLMTDDSGKKWKQIKADLKSGERISDALLSDDGMHGLIAGDKGSVRMTSNSGKSWASVDKQLTDNNKLKDGERISDALLSDDGMHGLIAGDKGSVRMTSDSGKNWVSVNEKLTNNNKLQNGERIRAASYSNDGKRILLVNNEGLVLMSVNGGDSWGHKNLKKLEDEWITVIMLSNDGKHALIASEEGSVFITANSGKEWIQEILKLNPNEEITTAMLSNNGKYGLIMSNHGRVFVKKDGGHSWETTQWDGGIPKLKHLISVPLDNDTHLAVAIDQKGNPYLLKNHPDMAEWKTWAFSKIGEKIAKNKLVRESRTFQQINSFLIDSGSIGKERHVGKPDKQNEVSNDSSADTRLRVLGVTLNDLTVMRVATMTILFFLLQLLVRLYQYSLRLANFWDSRADAILLHQNFADKKAEKFDDLVQALAPDTYDFKPMPGSLFGLRWPGRNP